MIKDNLKATGQVTVEKVTASGETEVLEIKNLVVTSGLNYIAGRMVDSYVNGADTHTFPSEMTHMAIGDDNTAPALADTTLGSQLHRTAFDSVQVSANTVTYRATFEPGDGTGAVVEAGIFDQATGGTMLCRTVFPVVNKEVGDTISITWAVTVS